MAEERNAAKIGRCNLKVLSLNVWGLHWLGSVRIRERLSYIVHELKKYDIVGLQEVWKTDDYNYLVEQLQHDLPHHTYLSSGIIGSGLCVFSRYPLQECHSHIFRVCGSVRYFLDGELFSGKGVLMCRVATPTGIVNVYNTHLDPRNRDVQCLEIYSFVSQSRGDAPVIILGDFNTKTTHQAYDFLLASLDIQDVFANDPQDTCDLRSNMYTLKNMSPKRIDYIFYANPTSPASPRLHVQSKCLAVTGLIPGKDFPYSDHEGVETVFRLEQEEENHKHTMPQDTALAIKVFQEMKSTLQSRRPVRMSVSMGVASYIIMGVVTLLLSQVLNSWVHPTLHIWGLGWLSHACAAALGSIAIFVVISTMLRGKNALAVDSNLEIAETAVQHLIRTSNSERSI